MCGFTDGGMNARFAATGVPVGVPRLGTVVPVAAGKLPWLRSPWPGLLLPDSVAAAFLLVLHSLR